MATLSSTVSGLVTSYAKDGTPIYQNSDGKTAKYDKKDGVYFYVKDDLRLLLYMTATTDYDIDSTMNVTVQPMQSGETITDNYLRAPRSASINGVVVASTEGTLIKTSYRKNAEAFVSIVERWRDQKRILTLICPYGQKLMSCVITKFNAKKDSSIENGLKVTLVFQEIILKTNVEKTISSGKKASKAGTAAKKQVGNTATTTGSAPSACKALQTANDTQTETLNSTQLRLLANCKANKTFGSSGKFTASDENAVADYYKRKAGNPTTGKGIGTR